MLTVETILPVAEDTHAIQKTRKGLRSQKAAWEGRTLVLYLLVSVAWTKASQSLLTASASACARYSNYMVIANRSIAPPHCIPG